MGHAVVEARNAATIPVLTVSEKCEGRREETVWGLR